MGVDLILVSTLKYTRTYFHFLLHQQVELFLTCVSPLKNLEKIKIENIDKDIDIDKDIKKDRKLLFFSLYIIK